jgi:hypothetical protein
MTTHDIGTAAMDDSPSFRYRPACSAPACDRPALYKIAAIWSDGTSRELKNYGLTCENHRDSQLIAAQSRLRSLRLSDAESVGPVELYLLRSGCRDVDLPRAIEQRSGIDL